MSNRLENYECRFRVAAQLFRGDSGGGVYNQSNTARLRYSYKKDATEDEYLHACPRTSSSINLFQIERVIHDPRPVGAGGLPSSSHAPGRQLVARTSEEDSPTFGFLL